MLLHNLDHSPDHSPDHVEHTHTRITEHSPQITSEYRILDWDLMAKCGYVTTIVVLGFLLVSRLPPCFAVCRSNFAAALQFLALQSHCFFAGAGLPYC